ncbi:hypothetical protein EVAR_34740_1 [Eumeta japonica]|uniref:RNA-directed DNA polymerase n=1 Tax=Eumeta variegata TaxID=151549 RepID=A0A4C1XE89_EUMVA|nr:hypothetical protein EVAR_34740_1 [Eumeta japonica]
MLNAKTIPDRYPIKYIHDFAHSIAGCKVFSTIDLVKRITKYPSTTRISKIPPSQRPLVCLSSRFGRNPKDERQHEEHLYQLFERIKEYGILVNTSKCVFGVSEVTFLGYHISASGTKPKESKILAIRDFPAPKTVKQLRRFLGMLNFYRRFIPDAAQAQAPLNTLLTGSGKPPTRSTSPASRSKLSSSAKDLSTAVLLAHPNCEAKLALTTDASDVALRAVLQQYQNEEWQPLVLFSRKL